MWNDIETTSDYMHFPVASKTVADLIIEKNREKPRFEKIVDGYTGFLFLDKEWLPEVAMHWSIGSTTWSRGTMRFSEFRCQKGVGESRWRKNSIAENVSGNLIRKEHKALCFGGAFFLTTPQTVGFMIE